jgi:hypothetical protein
MEHWCTIIIQVTEIFGGNSLALRVFRVQIPSGLAWDLDRTSE